MRKVSVWYQHKSVWYQYGSVWYQYGISVWISMVSVWISISLTWAVWSQRSHSCPPLEKAIKDKYLSLMQPFKLHDNQYQINVKKQPPHVTRGRLLKFFLSLGFYFFLGFKFFFKLKACYPCNDRKLPYTPLPTASCYPNICSKRNEI